VKIRLKNRLLVLTAENEEEARAAESWISTHADHVFVVNAQDQETFLLRDLGLRSEACREPIEVQSRSADEAVRLISNFAHTPFMLHGRQYASVEGFWQGLKFVDETDRKRLAQLHGSEAKRAGQQAPEAETFQYQGTRVRVGCYEHWELMSQACGAKFTQHDAARHALLSTGTRPLTHRMRRDSRTIPGVIMADIWMNIRARLEKG